MNISLIGTAKEIADVVTESALQHLHFSIYNLDLNHRDKTLFLQQSNPLMIHTKDKKQCLNIIKEWSNYHSKGTLILRRVYDEQFGDKIYTWLKKRGKKINVVIIPRIETFNCKNDKKVVLFGEKWPSSFTKDLRKGIAVNGKFVIVNKLKETALLYLASYSYQFLNARFLKELQSFSKRKNIDSEYLIRGLGQLMNIDYRKLRQIREMEGFKPLQKDSYQWIISSIKNVMETWGIQDIVVFGYDEKALKLISKLAIRSIRVYTCNRNKKILSKKIAYFNDPYVAAEKGDIVINLSTEDDIQSISLIRLAEKLNKKIMIDSHNLFELYEMSALHWRYISKGRPAIV